LESNETIFLTSKEGEKKVISLDDYDPKEKDEALKTYSGGFRRGLTEKPCTHARRIWMSSHY